MKFLLVPMLLLLASCARQPEIVLSGPTMGTTYTVRVVAAPPAVTAAKLRETIDEVLATIDRQMSGYRADSELSRFNASTSTEWFDASPELITVIEAALEVGERSGGALDITVAPLVALWGFGPGGGVDVLPDDSQVQAARQRTGYRKLHVRRNAPALRKEIDRLEIDLNSVAPGYAVDLLIERFAALGVEHCMVDIGGEIRVLGRNHRSEAWRIAVEKPVNREPEPFAILQLDDVAVATSGEYRHSVVRDGIRYSHTIDPRTGRPVNHDLASVAVVARNAMAADAWATALNVLGAEQGYELAARTGVAALFIREEAGALRWRATPELERYVAVLPYHE